MATLSGAVWTGATAASTSSATWTEASVANPPAGRVSASMATDPTGKAVLFGGSSALGPDLADTWTWDGSAWTQQHPATSPPARSGAVMAYDPATNTTVLFGGSQASGPDLADTWTWDGSAWTQQHPATSPPARDGAVMAYDPVTRNLVLFGGETFYPGQIGPTTLLADTWTWDGSTWTQQHPATSPPARTGAVMAQTSNASQPVVLFGGSGTSGTVGDTWTWDGTTWTEQAPTSTAAADGVDGPTSPSVRSGATMAFDAATGNDVLFGGLGGLQEEEGQAVPTYTWDGTAWAEQAAFPSPPTRSDAAMAYEPGNATVVLFGGFESGSYDNDTWVYTDANSSATPPTTLPTPPTTLPASPTTTTTIAGLPTTTTTTMAPSKPPSTTGSLPSSSSGAITEYTLPKGGGPNDIVAGPNGQLWFTDAGLAEITTAGVLTQFNLPSGLGAINITVGPDHALWFTNPNGSKSQIGRMTTGGSLSAYSTSCAPAADQAGGTVRSNDPAGLTNGQGAVCGPPGDIATGPDGKLWFTQYPGSNSVSSSVGGPLTPPPTWCR